MERSPLGKPSRNERSSITDDCNGGASRNRTDDLKLAKLALSQLSYGPDPTGFADPRSVPNDPPKWWAWEDLNFRPHAYQARALTN
jgi:hypothetical protein